jgi:hypothetical protein
MKKYTQMSVPQRRAKNARRRRRENWMPGFASASMANYWNTIMAMRRGAML